MQEAIAKRNSNMYGYYKSVFEDGFEGGYPVDWDEEIIRLAEESLVQRVRESLEEITSPYYKNGPVSIGNSEKTHNMTMGFHDCIEHVLELPILLTPKLKGDE